MKKLLETSYNVLKVFSSEDQLKIWDLINQWADQAASEDAKASLRQRIHGCAHVRRLRKNSIAQPEREREASEKLLPMDILIRHAWLFTSQWIELPSDETEDEDYSYEKNRQRLHELRLNALCEIWEVRGFCGVSALIEKNQDGSKHCGQHHERNLKGAERKNRIR